MNQNSVCVDIMLSFGRVGLGCEGCSAAGTSPCKGNHHKGDWGLILHQWCWILPCRAGSCPCFCSRVSPGHLPTPRVSLWMVAHTSLTPRKLLPATAWTLIVWCTCVLLVTVTTRACVRDRLIVLEPGPLELAFLLAHPQISAPGRGMQGQQQEYPPSRQELLWQRGSHGLSSPVGQQIYLLATNWCILGKMAI